MNRAGYMAVVAGAGILGGVVGCSPSADPREGGLAGGIHGLASGAYEERVEARRASLARLESIQSKLRKDRSELEAERGAAAARLMDEQVRLQGLRQNTRILADNVSHLGQNLREDDARVASVRARLAGLDREIGEIEEATRTGRMKQEELRQRSAALEDEYRKLMDLYIELGK